jgi:hypothetical protein
MIATDELTPLIKGFQVTALGGGDPTAGCNLLAAMACTLANLAPDDGSIVHPDGSPARLGTSLLTHGSATSGCVVDEIVTELCQKQDNLIQHLQSYLTANKKWKARPHYVELHTADPGEADSMSYIERTQHQDSAFRRDHWQTWRAVLDTPAHPSLAQIMMQPKFFVSVRGRKDIETQMTKLRPGPALVHLGLTHPHDIGHFSDDGAAVLEGRYNLENGTRTIKGHLLITDPMHVLATAAQEPDERTLWLGQLVWLSDGDHGPDAPTPDPNSAVHSSAPVEKNFRQALGQLLAQRLSSQEEASFRLCADIRPRLRAWQTFLTQMEPQLPGISMAARNLLTSLFFGLQLMTRNPKELCAASVDALARFLVGRMAQARLSIMRSGELVRSRNQIARIFGKLGNGPADSRKICRDLKISSAERDRALRWMQSAKLVTQQQHKEWKLCEGARLNFADCTAPLLEV